MDSRPRRSVAAGGAEVHGLDQRAPFGRGGEDVERVPAQRRIMPRPRHGVVDARLLAMPSPPFKTSLREPGAEQARVRRRETWVEEPPQADTSVARITVPVTVPVTVPSESMSPWPMPVVAVSPLGPLNLCLAPAQRISLGGVPSAREQHQGCGDQPCVLEA